MEAPPPVTPLGVKGKSREKYQMEVELAKLEKHLEEAKRIDLPSLNFTHYLHEIIEGYQIDITAFESGEKCKDILDTAHILLDAMGQSTNPPYRDKTIRSLLTKTLRSYVDNDHIRKIEGCHQHSWLNGGHRYIGRAISGNLDTRYKPRRSSENLLTTTAVHNLLWLTSGNEALTSTNTYKTYFDDNDLINQLVVWNRDNQLFNRKWLPCDSHDGHGVTQGTHGFFVDPKLSTWRSPFNHIWEYDTSKIDRHEFVEAIMTDIIVLLKRNTFTPLFVDRSTFYGLDSTLGLLKLKITDESYNLKNNLGDPLKLWKEWENYESILVDGKEAMTDLFAQAWLILHTPRWKKELGSYLPLSGIGSLKEDKLNYGAWARGYNQLARSFPCLVGMLPEENNRYNWERTFFELRKEYQHQKQMQATLQTPQAASENTKQTYAMLFLRSAMQQESHGLTESYSRSVGMGESETHRLNPTTLVEVIGVHTEGARITQRKCWWFDRLESLSTTADIHYNYITGRTTEPTQWGTTMTETKMEEAKRTTEFVPSWKDNRPPKLVNVSGAPPKGFNHYEVRCEKCNGRVTLSTPSGSLKTKVKCPHCKDNDIEVIQ